MEGRYSDAQITSAENDLEYGFRAWQDAKEALDYMLDHNARLDEEFENFIDD